MLAGGPGSGGEPQLPCVRLDLPLEDRVYETRLGPRHIHHLAHHRVGNRPVLPGAAYLEILSSALQAELPGVGWIVEDLVIAAPLYLEGETAIQLVLRPAGDEGFRLTFFAREDGRWREHATGRVAALQPSESGMSFDAAATAARLTEASVGDLYARLSEQGVTYGAGFDGIERLWVGSGEALAQLRPRHLHAASLDSALQALIAAAGGGAGWMSGVERIRWEQAGGRPFWSHARLRARLASRVYGDVRVYDDEGRAVVELEGVAAVSNDRTAQEAMDTSWMFTLAWQPLLRPSVRPAPSQAWLVVGDPGAAFEDLARTLEDLGARVWTAPAAERAELARVLEHVCIQAGGGLAGVALLANGGADRRDALALMQALPAVEWRDAPRLWFVTKSVHKSDGAAFDPAPSLVAGLARVFSSEHPEFRCGTADWDGARDALTHLSAAMLSDPVEREIAVRSGRLLAHRLAPAQPDAETAPVVIRPDATYLVTGGLSGLGLEAARFLAARGARHLWLISRQGADRPSRAAAAAELRAQGVEVTAAAVDVADETSVDRVLARIAQEAPPLRGVIHSAGVVEDAAIGRLAWAGFERVLDPKLRGALNLHERTLGLTLDFFVIFSSAASVLGPMGQAAHAAASASLDALAHWRRAANLPALSIGWGPWNETGAAAGGDLPARLARRGVRPIGNAEGARMLEMAMSLAEPHLVALRIDWDRWALEAPLGAGALWSGLAGATDPNRSAGGTASFSDDFLTREAASLLQIEPGRLDPLRRLSDYGFDSLMAISLRKRLEDSLGVRIPIVHFFQSQTLRELSATIMDQLECRRSPSLPGPRLKLRNRGTDICAAAP
jgi:NAD(P)-dependent dehydrogenase (short-subunit alcohol dehydrogenase family)/acyl carrier protein